MTRNAVVLYSGGIGSWVAAQRVVAGGQHNVTLLFTDTKSEDADTYRFLRDGAKALAVPLVEIADGRDIWQVFRDVRFLGNTRADPCSRVLKRDLSRRWLTKHFDPADTDVVVGIDWTESHRFERMKERWVPWTVLAPICEAPYLNKEQMHQAAEAVGIPRQYLYRIGAPHANCGGGCVKAGIGHFARLLSIAPDRFAAWEANEESLRAELGNVSILRDRFGPTTTPLTLRQLRARIGTGDTTIDMFEIGGCGCMIDTPEDTA